FLLGKAVVGFLRAGFVSLGGTSVQQVEVPRAKRGSVVQQVKNTTAQPAVEVRPEGEFTTSSAPAPKLTIEQMRRAGALAAQKIKDEDHDIEIDASEPAPAPVP